MNEFAYRYTIAERVPIDEIGVTLLLSVIAAEALYGETEARLNAYHALDADARSVAIDAATPVGRDLNKLFVGFLVKEFGAASFTVRRVDRARQSQNAPESVTA
jgi:hypothetical protein